MRSSAVNPEIHDQGAELDLLAALVPQLRNPSAVDVGSERGAVAGALRADGFEPVWLLEPFPGSVAHLRDRFRGDPGARVLAVAAGIQDGVAELHLARGGPGGDSDAYHSLHPGENGGAIRWKGSVPVEVRSLDSLADAGEIPRALGLLKIDAEGSDADVLRGAASLESQIVMVEYWRDLPDSVGRCPYTVDELRSLVEPLGPRHFLFVRHGRRHVSIGRWDVADAAEGEWGNLVFVADSLVGATDAALPAIERALADRIEAITAEQERAALERQRVIRKLT